MSMNQDLITTLQQLYQKFQQHDAQQATRLLRYRNIEPDSAQYIAMLIRVQQSKHILEIGTSTGYSTLWMADAASVSQGHITTLEIEAERTEMARQYAQQLGLHQRIDFKVMDALEFIQQSDQLYDFILLDAERTEYMNYWAHLKRLLHPQHGVLIIDNVISHAAEVKEFLRTIRLDPAYLSITLSLGAGLFMVTPKN